MELKQLAFYKRIWSKTHDYFKKNPFGAQIEHIRNQDLKMRARFSDYSTLHSSPTLNATFITIFNVFPPTQTVCNT